MLEATVKELQQQKKRVLRQIDGLRAEVKKLRNAIKVLTKLSGPVAVAAKPARKRKISAAGRRAIAAAQRARWAKIKAKKAAK